MKVTFEIPEALYRQVKAKSALEGRPVRGVATALFKSYVRGDALIAQTYSEGLSETTLTGSPPPWFGMLRPHVRDAQRHDMEAIRESIGRGLAEDREP